MLEKAPCRRNGAPAAQWLIKESDTISSASTSVGAGRKLHGAGRVCSIFFGLVHESLNAAPAEVVPKGLRRDRGGENSRPGCRYLGGANQPKEASDTMSDTKQNNGDDERPADVLELKFEGDQYHVTLQGIDFERHQDMTIERVVFRFRLHSGNGWTIFPVTITEVGLSLDELWRKAVLTLYSILCTFAEKTRRMEGLPKISFKDAPPSAETDPVDHDDDGAS
jgi:hypothetical protein